MILYRRIKDDKTGKLERIKEDDLPTENLFIIVGRIIFEIQKTIKKNEVFFIVFSEEEETKINNPLKLFSIDPIDVLMSIFRNFFAEFFSDNIPFPFATYLPIKDNILYTGGSVGIEPRLAIQISLD